MLCVHVKSQVSPVVHFYLINERYPPGPNTPTISRGRRKSGIWAKIESIGYICLLV
jgi:hypothetical protein